MTRRAAGSRRPLRVTLVVQNLPVPLDRRLWCEAGALRDSGCAVTVVAPRGDGQPWSEELEGIRVCRYPAPPEASGAVGYLLEFLYCWIAVLLWCLRIRVTRGMDVLHAANPPDTFWAVALLLRPFGTRFVFDQHDACPELYAVKFPERRGGRLHRMLLWLERRSYGRAAAVIAPNGSYARIARERGGLPPESVFTVRSAPPRSRFAPGPGSERWRRGRRHLVGYIGVMNSQDGVDLLVRAAAHVARARGRDEIGWLLIGDGTMLEPCRRLAAELGVSDRVEFTGRLHDLAVIREALASADVCAASDPRNEFNDVSSMNKVVEYMALGKPVVGFDLAETRATLGDGGILVPDADPARLGDAVLELLDDPERRARLGRANRERFLAELSWEAQVPALLDAYRAAVPGAALCAADGARPALSPDPARSC